MKRKLTTLALIVCAAITVAAKSPRNNLQSREKESIVGLWKAKFDKAPAVDIELKVKDGKLVGVATFCGADGSEVKSKAESPVNDLVFDGNSLLCTVKRDDGSYFKPGLTSSEKMKLS